MAGKVSRYCAPVIESPALKAPRLFLDVSASILGQPWRDRVDAAGAARALAMVQQHGFPDILARVLAGRGVGIDEAPAWLDPTLRALMPDPDRLIDMGTAVARLRLAIERRETVAIFGDYDVDGACSAALLGEFLGALDCPYVIHIPDRIFEGYGPNNEAIRALREAGAGLLATVDCGTTSAEAIAFAQTLGLGTLVIDHHQAPEALPPALAIVNPNRQDDLSGLGHLCAAGVVYMVLVGLNRALREAGAYAARAEPDLRRMLDLVALATVADVVPLRGLNRAFVLRGLEVMRARGRAGLTALMDIAGADGPPRPYHLGFLVGPRINAGGRIGDAALGAKLLLMRDPDEAKRLAENLDRLNRERQVVEAATLEAAEAEALLALGLEDKGPLVVVAGEGWHPGVVGLVASRLKDRFQRPAIAIALNGAVGTGSGRSIAGVDLGRAIRAAVEAGVLVKGGGHAMAAGLTLRTAKLGEFRAFLEAQLAAQVGDARAGAGLAIDAALTAAGATPELMELLERAGPFGAGNPEPVLAFPAHRVVDAAPVGNGHVRLRIQAGDGTRLNAIAFRAAAGPLGPALLNARGEALHLAGTLAVDRYGGKTRVQLRVVDAAAVGTGR